MTHDNYYSTTDLALASAIITTGYALSHTTKDERGKGTFYFEASHDLSKLAEDYFLGKVRVDPLRYAMTTKTLKSCLYNAL